MNSLQPPNANIYERAVEQSRASRWAMLQAAVPAIRTGKRVSPAPDVLPFLVFEDGLGMLKSYVTNIYELLDGRGKAWMGKRGTYEAVARALAFLNLAGIVEPANPRRVWWNSAQVRFSSLPPVDRPLLAQIDGLMRLSLPMRSDFRRGVYGYDVGALRGNVSRLNRSMLERESGIRLNGAGPLWSFGRDTEVSHLLTQAEGVAIGNWIDVPADEGLAWITMNYPWVTANFPWGSSAADQRRSLMATWFASRTFYLRLTSASGQIIGYRRCRCARPVMQSASGVYRFQGSRYTPAPSGQRVYIEAMTGFNDADGVSTSSVALMSGVILAPGVKPGKLWLQPNEVTAGTAFVTHAISLPLRATVRERFKFLVRF